jgi:hypothetical protein
MISPSVELDFHHNRLLPANRKKKNIPLFHIESRSHHMDMYGHVVCILPRPIRGLRHANIMSFQNGTGVQWCFQNREVPDEREKNEIHSLGLFDGVISEQTSSFYSYIEFNRFISSENQNDGRTYELSDAALNSL